MVLNMDIHKPRNGYQMSPFLKLSNGYILPHGKRTPNTLFVGGIDLKVEEQEISELFGRFGAVKEVKIITYRGGISKGYGFVYFNEDVDIHGIVEQQISFKGKKLKLGPAIMKERSSRTYHSGLDSGFVPTHLVGPAPWMSPAPLIYCTCCPPMAGGMAPPSASVLSGGNPYTQPYSYSSMPGVSFSQVPISYTQNPYAYTGWLQ